MKEFTWDVIAQIVALLGTGGWLGYVVKKHGERLGAIELAIVSKASNNGVKELEKDLDALGNCIPTELEARLREVEQGKLGVKDHAAFCAATMKTIEVMLASIKSTVEQHASRLARGDDLLIELKAATAELKAALRETRNSRR